MNDKPRNKINKACGYEQTLWLCAIPEQKIFYDVLFISVCGSKKAMKSVIEFSWGKELPNNSTPGPNTLNFTQTV